MSRPIHLANFRASCRVRTEPYWAAPIRRGQFLGYRKISAVAGSWVARIRIEDESGKLTQRYQSLGGCTDLFDYNAAQAAAVAWFATLEAGAGVDSKSVATVAAACRAYVTELRKGHREPTAHDAEKRFERTVFEHPLGGKSLVKLRAADLKSWRNGFKLARASSNRTLTALKAALNLAMRNRYAPASLAIELRSVAPYKNAGKRRDLYLDLRQRRALLKAIDGAVRDLIEAVIVTGCRAGELTSMTCGAFDARTKAARFMGKTGSRTVPLSPPAVALFKRLSKGRAPGDQLLTRDDGKPWSHSDWDELVREAAAKAKLPPGVCLYTLRHSWITSALQGGLATLDVARLVGTSVVMIEKHYGHLVASATRARLAKVAML